jgi:hypothetical protein
VAGQAVLLKDMTMLSRSFLRFTLSAMAAPLLLAAFAGPSLADVENPDWPCVWRKVVEIDAAAIWDGPALDGAQNWRNDDAVRKLSAYVISRRLKPEEVEEAIKTFAESLPEATRDQKLTELFTGALSRTNEERKIVISGIERFHNRQLARAKEIEAQGVELPPADLMTIPQAGEAGADNPAGKVDDALAAAQSKDNSEERLNWDIRVFQERQQNIPIACEIPQLMDERVGLVARTIRGFMKS